MINLSMISNNSLIGKLLRLPLRLVPTGSTVRIIQGVSRGKKWIVGSGVHGYWLGCFEYHKQKIFSRIIPKAAIVYDIGAHVGFYTLLSSVLVGPKGKVFAFEPAVRNLRYLKKHLQLNHSDNVTVIEAAVSDKDGESFLREAGNDSRYYLSDTGSLKVNTVTLDRLVSEGRIPPADYIKIDAEGGELAILFGAKKTITDYSPTIFLSTHGKEMFDQCREFLLRFNYNIESLGKTDEWLVFKGDKR